eukprot:364516-Chlamydomonas_euryale.AAC.12
MTISLQSVPFTKPRPGSTALSGYQSHNRKATQQIYTHPCACMPTSCVVAPARNFGSPPQKQCPSMLPSRPCAQLWLAPRACALPWRRRRSRAAAAAGRRALRVQLGVGARPHPAFDDTRRPLPQHGPAEQVGWGKLGRER